jgi:hypothetical protein
MCFVWIWEQTAIVSLYSINWLVFTTETECVYCAVRSAHTMYLCVLWESENKQWLLYVPPGLTHKNSTFCPHSVCMCFVWIWEKTVVTICTTRFNTQKILRSAHTVYLCVLWGSENKQWLLYVPPGLTHRNSTFCPHSVFMCFVWIWEQTTVTICTTRFNTQLFYVLHTQCIYVFCVDLRTNSGNYMYHQFNTQ